MNLILVIRFSWVEGCRGGGFWQTFSVTAEERVERPPVAKALSQRWAMPDTSESEIQVARPCAKDMVARMHDSRV